LVRQTTAGEIYSTEVSTIGFDGGNIWQRALEVPPPSCLGAGGVLGTDRNEGSVLAIGALLLIGYLSEAW
jgi:hypothetical protein